jgi:hypothetical protein
MSLQSIGIAIQGFLGTVSPTLLKIASQGLLDTEGPPPATGGIDETSVGLPFFYSGELQPKRENDVMRIAMWACGCGAVR